MKNIADNANSSFCNDKNVHERTFYHCTEYWIIADTRNKWKEKKLFEKRNRCENMYTWSLFNTVSLCAPTSLGLLSNAKLSNLHTIGMQFIQWHAYIRCLTPFFTRFKHEKQLSLIINACDAQLICYLLILSFSRHHYARFLFLPCF